MSDKLVYLMRGLPACGKSHRARRIVGDGGVVLETDQYFYTQAGDDPGTYDYSDDLLPVARQWNFDRFCAAVAAGDSPIVVDRGNGLNAESARYAKHAVANGYGLVLAEPDSPWWQELRVLLKFKHHVHDELFDVWASKLSEATRDTHRVPASTIRHWMSRWRYDLTVEEILNLEPASTQGNP